MTFLHSQHSNGTTTTVTTHDTDTPTFVQFNNRRIHSTFLRILLLTTACIAYTFASSKFKLLLFNPQHPPTMTFNSTTQSLNHQRKERIAFVQISDFLSTLPPQSSILLQNLTLADVATIHLSIYCQLHGYDYVRVIDESHEKHGVWTKVKHLPAILQRYDLIIFLDFDAYIVNISLPITALLDQWNFRSTSLILQAFDPDGPDNYVTDATGARVLNLNTGFMVLRNHPKTILLLQQWYACTETIPECQQYTSKNQPAWNIWFRPQLIKDEELVAIPCGDANGGVVDGRFICGDHSCIGKYISHLWTEKEEAKRILTSWLLRDIWTLILSKTHMMTI